MAQFTAQGPIALPGGTTVVFTTPYPIQAGSRAKDKDGNEYMFCDFGTDVSPATPVSISSAYVASRFPVNTTGARGAMGVVCAVGTTAQAGWVQIYGRALMQINGPGTGGTQPSPSDAAAGPTTLSTSDATVFVLGTSLVSPHALAWVSGNVSTSNEIRIEGLCVATDASPTAVTAVCDTTSGTASQPGAKHTGAQIGVFMNYPTIIHRNYGEN